MEYWTVVILMLSFLISPNIEGVSIEQYYGSSENVKTQDKLDIAPQVKLDLRLSNKADKIEVKGSRIYLDQIFTCHAPDIVCQDVLGLDLGQAPEPGRNMTLLFSELREKILQDLGEQFEIEIEGPERIFVYSQAKFLDRKLIEDELKEFLKRQSHSTKRWNLKSIYVTPGLKTFEGELQFDFSELESILKNLSEKEWDFVRKPISFTSIVHSMEKDFHYQLEVPIRLRLGVEMLVPVAKHAIPFGRVLNHESLIQDWREIRDEPLINYESFVGYQVTRRIPKGHYMTSSDLKAPYAFKRGELVEVIMMSHGLQLRGQAKALGHGVLGQQVPIALTSNGKRLMGIVISSSTVKVTN